MTETGDASEVATGAVGHFTPSDSEHVDVTDHDHTLPAASHLQYPQMSRNNDEGLLGEEEGADEGGIFSVENEVLGCAPEVALPKPKEEDLFEWEKLVCQTPYQLQGDPRADLSPFE